MERLVCCVLLFGAISGCYDFSGDRNKLGFNSNLYVGAHRKWNPDAAVAAGSRARFEAVEIVGESAEEPPLVHGTARGTLRVVTAEGRIVEVEGEGGARGVVRFDGEVRDRFGVRFAEPSVAALQDPLLALLDEEESIARLALVPGSTLVLWPAVLDEGGAELGFDPADLDLAATGSVSAWVEGSEVRLGADGTATERGSLAIGLGERPFGGLEVVLAGPEDVASLEIRCDRVVEGEESAEVFVSEPRLADGTRLYGLPVAWSWTAGAEVREEDVEMGRDDLLVLAHGGLSAPLDVTATGAGLTATASVVP